MTSAVLHETLAPLRSNPSESAILLDIDGTLAPIVDNAGDATVPESTRQLIIAMSRRYGQLACISGRRASEARAMVSVGTIAYVGAHGGELLRPGWTEALVDPELLRWAPRVEAFRLESDTGELRRRRVRIEDKGTIIGYHWRGASDEADARAAVDAIAAQAKQAGLEVHWGRKVMEVRPPVRIDKGLAVRQVLGDRRYAAVLYVGDDTTDLDAFRAVRALVQEGEVGQAICVGVRSDDAPAGVAAEADLIVPGTDGVRELLAKLAAS